jgi:hypothetical protein
MDTSVIARRTENRLVGAEKASGRVRSGRFSPPPLDARQLDPLLDR